MKRKHAVWISLAVGAAVLAGTVAATKSVQLGRPAAAAPDAQASVIASRTKALNRSEIALRKALAQRPPKLPPLPVAAASVTPAPRAPIAAATAPQAQAQRVVYVRPAPIVRQVTRADDEHESAEHEHESDDDGGSQHDNDERSFDD